MRTFAIAGMAAACVAIASTAPASQDVGAVLKRQTQALMDAVSDGKPQVWANLLDDKVVITDEAGAISYKPKAVSDIQPLPKGASGTITITNWHATVDGNVAVATFIDDEHENYHGQKLHALYRATATWIKRASGWKLLAMQVLALRQDPPAVTLPAKLTDEYVGTYSGGEGLAYVISKSGNAIMGASNGGKPVELKAELADVLFAPGQPRSRRIFQRDANGAIIGFVSRREERDVVFKRVK